LDKENCSHEFRIVHQYGIVGKSTCSWNDLTRLFYWFNHPIFELPSIQTWHSSQVHFRVVSHVLNIWTIDCLILFNNKTLVSLWMISLSNIFEPMYLFGPSDQIQYLYKISHEYFSKRLNFLMRFHWSMLM